MDRYASLQVDAYMDVGSRATQDAVAEMTCKSTVRSTLYH